MGNGWARLTGVTVSGALVVGWCTPQAVAVARPPGDQVVIDVVKVNGSGCRPGSAVTALSPDHLAFTVTYSRYSAVVGPAAARKDAQKDCKLTLRISAPRDVTYAIARVDYRGFAQLAPGVTASQTAAYSFAGAGHAAAVEHDFAGPYSDDWQTGDEEPSAFEPCGKQRHLVIDTALTLHPGTSAPAETSIIAMDSTDATVKTTYRLLWKSCTVGHLNRVAP